MQTVSDVELQQLTTHVAHSLLARGWQLTTVESCTGGWVGKCCTDIAGSSAWFDRGFITYSNQAKQDLVYVHASTLDRYGAVSEQVAIEMAEGALSASTSTISVAITGTAGPDGGTDDKPVGTVWFAWAVKRSATKTAKHHFEGDRESVRRQAVRCALQGIIKNARD